MRSKKEIVVVVGAVVAGVLLGVLGAGAVALVGRRRRGEGVAADTAR
jgi:hypothetical protein